MVTKIPKPSLCSVDFISSVLKKRLNDNRSSPEFYQKIGNALIYSYMSYEDKKGNPEQIKQLNFQIYEDNLNNIKARKDTLINLYENRSDNYIYPILRNLRKNHNLMFCPFCGEEVIPSTLDHFLPKEKFPEYSICLINLIPMCTKCQGKDAKGEKILSQNNQRIFLNPYFDSIDEFLILEILPPFDKPDFILNLKNVADKTIYELLASHVVELNIYERYLNFATSQHILLLKLAKKNKATGKSIKEKVEIYLEEREEKSKNTWAAIYYRSVLNNKNLIKYLDFETLPDCI